MLEISQEKQNAHRFFCNLSPLILIPSYFLNRPPSNPFDLNASTPATPALTRSYHPSIPASSSSSSFFPFLLLFLTSFLLSPNLLFTQELPSHLSERTRNREGTDSHLHLIFCRFLHSRFLPIAILGPGLSCPKTNSNPSKNVFAWYLLPCYGSGPASTGQKVSVH